MEILLNLFEGDESVMRTHLDHLGFQFEISSGLMLIIWKALVPSSALWHMKHLYLEKRYKEKKLVNKLLRCLPTKFATHKAVLKMTINTDELKFDQLVGMLKRDGDI